MSKQNTIRVVVLAGLLAWPGVELYRYSVAKQQLAASEARRQLMDRALASLQESQRLVPGPDASAVIPVTNPAPQ